MAVKAKKLNSGNYRCQVYDYTDLTGKKHYRSFTSKDKKEAEKKANDYISNKENPYMKIINTDLSEISVQQAIDDYINLKRDVLSPSTIKSYIQMKSRFNGLKKFNLNELNNIILQRWITSLTRLNLNPKTIKNTYSLLISSIHMYDKSKVYDVTLPVKRKASLYTPNDSDIRMLLDGCSGTDLEIAILLAAFGPMRRGEIAAVTYGDISGNCISVNKAYAINEFNQWVLKPPKTYNSNRVIEFPDKVMDRIRIKHGAPEHEILKMNPNVISHNFIRLRNRLGLYDVRFHDLRHYAASILHAIGIPDKYIMERGGWQSDYTMKRVYQNTIDSESKKMTMKINNYFSEI